MPLWRQIGADSCRVSLVDLQMQSHVAGRWMNEGGAAGGAIKPDQPLESAFPGAVGLLARFGERDSAGDAPLAHMLSPRRWVYGWKVNEHVALIAQVQYVGARTAASEFDRSVVRLICEHWMTPELQAMSTWRAAAVPWDRAERRARAHAPRALWLALASLLACTLIGLWLLFDGAPQAAAQSAVQQRGIQRLAHVMDSTLVRSLSVALAGGDYGEVQELLAQHAALGNPGAAVVSNARGQVVAHAGLPSSLRVGAAVPPELLASSRVMALTAGGQSLGQLLVVAGTKGVEMPAARIDIMLRVCGAALCLVALTGGAMLGLFVRRRYR